MNPAIVVVGFDRDRCLERLLYSISKAHICSSTALIISIDKNENKRVYEIAKNFEWRHGKKEVIAHEKHLGLRDHIIACGDLTERYGGVIVLEDDLFVSPYFYSYAKKALEFYEEEIAIAGISLYAHAFNETARIGFRPLDDGSDVFFLQIASSWGQCWSKNQWRGFRRWYSERDKENTQGTKDIPADVLLWPESSWKKSFITYMIYSDRFFVYPRVSLSTNFGDPGTHYKYRVSVLQVPLQLTDKELRFSKIGDSLAVYDSFHEIMPDRLKALSPHLAEYDFECDFHGQKDISKVEKDFVITSRGCEAPVQSFGRELKPIELNVVYDINGNDIYLAEKEFCNGEVKEIGETDYAYYYNIPRELVSLDEQVKVKERSIHHYYYSFYSDTLKEKEQVIREKEQLITALYGSRSWKVTKPLRRLSVLFGDGRQKSHETGLRRAKDGSGGPVPAVTKKKKDSVAMEGEYTAVQKLAILKMNLLERTPVKILAERYRLDYDTIHRWQAELFDAGRFIAERGREMDDVLENLHHKRFKPTVILDVGADEGYWSLLAGRLFEAAKIFMIEASAKKEKSLRFICETDPRYHYFMDSVVVKRAARKDASGLFHLLSEGKIEKPNLVRINARDEVLRMVAGSGNLFDQVEVFIIRSGLLRINPEGRRAHELIGFMAERNFLLFDVSDYRLERNENDIGQINFVFVSAVSPMVGSGR